MRIFKYSALLLTTLFVVNASGAKELPPEGKKPADFQLPATSQMVLDNGLKVTFIPYGKTPKTTIRLITNTGNVDDGELPWLADLSFEMLKQGTAELSAKDIAEKAASMGGQINTSVAMDRSWIGADVLSEYAGDTVSVIAQMLLSSKFAENDLTLLKTNRDRSLKVALSQPGNQANQAFYKEIFGNHAYGNLFPTEQSLAKISVSDVKQFVTKNIVPNRSHLYISGVFEQQALVSKIKQAFADWQKGQPRSSGTVLTQTGPKVVMLEREKAPQSTIRLGLATISPAHQDAMKMTMTNSLLGGSFSSRITSNIREDKGYTYSPSSAVVNRVNAGLWYQAADITAESTGAALNEIFKEINTLANEAPSKEELSGIQNYMAGIFVLQNSSRSAIINQLAFMELHQLNDNYLKDYVSNIYKVTPKDISDTVKNYLTPEKMTLVVVGDKAQITPQLKAVDALKGYWK